MKYDLIITGGKIATDYSVFDGSIAVKDGKVAAILNKNAELPEAEKVIDANGKLVLPGCIDPHVHLEEPGQFSYRDGFEYGTKAAAIGGITSILEHPISIPPVKDEDSFNIKLDIASKACYIDFGLWGALTPDSVEHIKRLEELGCVAFKGFIPYCRPDYQNITDGDLFAAMESMAKNDTVFAFHAENAGLVDYGTKKMKDQGRKDPLAHLEARESLAEIEAVQRLILFAKVTEARLHIVHLSTWEGAELIKRAKAEGVRVTTETCPHFLAADCNFLKEKGPFAKLTPPLRRPENTEKMWDYVMDGTIDSVVSDHQSYTYEEKNAGIDDIWKADNGVPGVATLIPMMVDECLNKRNMPLDQFVRFTSTNAAKLYGLYPRKGTIIPGGDADFTIIDQHKKWTVDGKKLYRVEWSPYDGREVEGAVDATIVRGKLVFDKGQIVGEKGHGIFLKP